MFTCVQLKYSLCFIIKINLRKKKSDASILENIQTEFNIFLFFFHYYEVSFDLKLFKNS